MQARALAWHVGIGFLQGDLADRDERRRAALAMFGGAADPAGLARAQWFLAHTGIDLGDVAAAEELLSVALPAFEVLGDRWGTAAALAGRAKLAHIRADLAALRDNAERSADMFDKVSDRWGRLEASAWLAALAEMSGDHARAEQEHRNGLVLAKELRLWTEVAGRLGWLGWLALQRGDLAQAMAHCEQALRLAVEQGHRAGQIFAMIGLAFAARRDGRLDLAETHLRDVVRRTPRTLAEQSPPRTCPWSWPSSASSPSSGETPRERSRRTGARPRRTVRHGSRAHDRRGRVSRRAGAHREPRQRRPAARVGRGGALRPRAARGIRRTC